MRIIGKDVDATREATVVASGTLPNGKPVVVNADGTVSVVSETSYSESLSSATVFNTNNNIRLAAAFDSVNNKVIIAYYDYGTTSGQAIVGTVSGDTISFGTQVQFSNNVDVDITISVDTANDKVVIFYRDPDNSNYGTAKVGTISGTSISFGTAVVFSSYYAQYNSSAYDSTSGKVIVANRDGSVTDDGRAYVGTVSGTSISFGSAQTFQSGNTNRVGLIYDASVDRIVVVYISGSTVKSRVGTVSGSTISYGTEQSISGSGPGRLNIAGDNNGTVFIGYTEGGASDPLYALLATIGTSSLTAGSRVGVDSYVPGFDVVYDSAFDKWVVLYRVNTPSNAGKYRVGSGSGTTLTFETAVTYYNNNAEDVEVVFDSNSNKVVFAYRDSGDGGKGKARVFQNAGSLTNLTAENYIGISDGDIDTITQSESVGTPTVFESGELGSNSVAYDSANNKIVITYRDTGNNGYGTAVVGTVSGTSITFGTPVVFYSASTNNLSSVFDSSNGKIVTTYRNASLYPSSRVGTVSGTSISYGSEVVITASNNAAISSVYDSTNNKVVASYAGAGGGTVSTVVGTVSGTSISYGSATTTETAYNSSMGFDSTNGKVILSLQTVSNGGRAYVGTVSGTSITFGSATQYNSNVGQLAGVAHDTNANKVVIGYRKGGGEAAAIVGTVSGTSISFGSETEVQTSNTTVVAMGFDTLLNKVIYTYRYGPSPYNGRLRVGTVSGTSITFDTEVTFESGTTSNLAIGYDSTENTSVISYRDEGNSDYGTAVGYQAAGSYDIRGETPNGGGVKVLTQGSVSDLQSELTAGKSYYVQTNGTLSTTAGSPSVYAGMAVSATKLLVKG